MTALFRNYNIALPTDVDNYESKIYSIFKQYQTLKLFNPFDHIIFFGVNNNIIAKNENIMPN